MSHESSGKSNEWYTPKYIFDALGCQFKTDAASPKNRKFCHVPAEIFITKNSLSVDWEGFTWLNPPFGKRNEKAVWLEKMFVHGNGIVLTPDRSATDWWQDAALKCNALMQIRGKIKFIKPDGTLGEQPGNGTTLFAYGYDAVDALLRAHDNRLGIILIRHF